MKLSSLIGFVLVFCSSLLVGQTINKQGQGFFTWGYNRSFYAKSDIRFIGSGYDFTLSNVSANDRPTAWDPNIYLSPSNLTIPQFNCHFGVFLKDNLSISGGWDHMKYVVANGQNVGIEGYINQSVNSKITGKFNPGDEIYLLDEFLHLEHTDGLNFIRVNIDAFNTLWEFKSFRIRNLYGAGIGAMMPQTDFTFAAQRTNNNDHVFMQGFGLSTNIGLNFEIGKYFYLQFISHQGYINMPWVHTRAKAADRIKQEIWFQEYIFSFGSTFPIGLKKLEDHSSVE